MRKACYFFLIFSVKSNPLSSLYYYIHIFQSRSLLIFHLLACHFYQITWMQFVLIKLLNEPFVYSLSIYGIPCFSQRRLRWNCLCVCARVCVKERKLTWEKGTSIVKQKKKKAYFYEIDLIYLPSHSILAPSSSSH